MKKRTVIILSAVFALLLIAAGFLYFGLRSPYKAYIIEEHTGSLDSTICNFAEETSYHEDRLTGSKRAFTIYGKQYDFWYMGTFEDYHSAYREYYCTQSHGDCECLDIAIWIKVNQDTGRLDQLIYQDDTYMEWPSTYVSYEEALQSAKEYLSEYVNDIDSYILQENPRVNTTSDQAEYFFKFVRYIDGLPVYDHAVIDVYYGKVRGHEFFGFADFEDAPLPSEQDMAQMEKTIGDKLQKCYAPVVQDSGAEVTYKATPTGYVRLRDGSYAMEYECTVFLNGRSDGIITMAVTYARKAR